MILFTFFLSAINIEPIKIYMKKYKFDKAVLLIDENLDKLNKEVNSDSSLREKKEILYLKALCFEKMNREKDAMGVYNGILAFSPLDTFAFPHYWKLRYEMADSSGKIRVKKEFLNLIRNAEKSYKDIYSIYVSSLYLNVDSSFVDSLKKEIKLSYSDSKLSFDIEGEEFYDGLYPIWNNDTLKIEYLKNFIRNAVTDYWKKKAYKWLLYSYLKLKKYQSIIESGENWIKENPDDPEVLNYVSSMYLKLGEVYSQRFYNDALKYAILAEKNLSKLIRPEHISNEEWVLFINTFPFDIKFNIARAYEKIGEIEPAIYWMNKIIGKIHLSVNDEATYSPYYTYYGILLLDKGDTTKAKEYFVNALIEGDRGNRWTSKADSIMVLLEGSKDKVFEYARKLRRYNSPIFDDKTEEYGMKNIHGSRVAFGDFNRDRYPDLLLNGSRLFENMGGQKFIDVTEQMKIEAKGRGGVWLDFNRDGYLDIFVSGAGNNPDRILLNIKGKYFKDVTEKVWDSPDTLPTEGVGVVDFNKDGYPDIYLANYENWDLHIYYPDKFLLNKRGRKLIDITEEAGIIPPFNRDLAGRGVNCADYNNDGWTDIYVSNYRLTENFLWENQKGKRFVNKAPELRVNGDEVEGWSGHSIGSVWGDIDNDGDLDLFVANLAHPRYIHFSNRSMLYENRDSGFANIREDAGIKYSETHSDPAFVDFDNDGLIDLYITSVYPDRRSFLYKNMGNNKFKDITFLSGSRIFNGWGSGFADIDDDGDIDMVLKTQDGIKVLINRGNSNHYLKVKVKGRKNKYGLGTKVYLHYGEKTLMREVVSSRGTTSQDGYVLHFGLGKWGGEVTVEVIFPSGKIKKIKTDVDKTVIVKEGINCMM